MIRFFLPFLGVILLSSCNGGKSTLHDGDTLDLPDDMIVINDEQDGETKDTAEMDENDRDEPSDELSDGDELLPNFSDEIIASDDLQNDPDVPLSDEDPIVDTSSITWNGITAWVTVTGDTYRTYELSTDNILRDNYPPDKKVTIIEEPGQLRLRSGHLVFDALFALALQEVRQNSVSTISDASFNGGQPIPCECLITGEKWPYVWTRDTAYAAYLGLALVDPLRTMNSLRFKLSDRKGTLGGGGTQIVQDTGSGGSWPISTDRVVWALGAYETLKYLGDTDRTAFLTDAYDALKNTIEADRLVAYDPRDGLYRGETSFLDWREQSYPSWTKNDTVHIGMSKTLSTNLLHHQALAIAATLASFEGDTVGEARYAGWRDNLAEAIIAAFLPTNGTDPMSAMKLTELNDAAIPRHDLLGIALLGQGPAAVFGDDIILQQVSQWPHTIAGAPVIWPEQPWTPIYHNRAIWPFVSALFLDTGKQCGVADVVWRNMLTLIYGAAFNLSNMENFEFTTLANYFADGDYSGPVVNSRRQLWSIAGYLSMVVRTLFGFEATFDGIRLSPFLPRSARNEFFVNGDRMTLHDIPYRGKKITVELTLPPVGNANDGYYTAETVLLNGVATDFDITDTELEEDNFIELTLDDHHESTAGATVLSDTQPRTLFAPKEPLITGISSIGGHITLTLSRNGEPDTDTAFTIYRNGEIVAENVTSLSWTDADTICLTTLTCCYGVSQRYLPAGHDSFPSNPQCYWGESIERITILGPNAFTEAAQAVFEHGKLHFRDWGRPDETLTIPSFSPPATGDYFLQIEYGNGRPIDTGITACQKFIDVYENGTDTLVASGPVAMPHLGANDWERWGNSSFLPVRIEIGKTYRFVIRDGMNMSYFAHFESYGGAGGGVEGLNRVNISALKVLQMRIE